MSTEDDLRQQLADITTELYDAGVITATGGNVSVRSANRANAAWITPSQIFKGHLQPEQMVLIDFNGQKIAGDEKPSVESVYHGGILRQRPKINAVVHSHAPLATVFGMCDMEMQPITTEAVSLSNMPVIPWHLGGTQELAQAVLEHIGETKAKGAFLRNHGLITLGKNLRKAADATYTVEHTIKILLACKLTGAEPSVIPEEAVQLVEQSLGAI